MRFQREQWASLLPGKVLVGGEFLGEGLLPLLFRYAGTVEVAGILHNRTHLYTHHFMNGSEERVMSVP